MRKTILSCFFALALLTHWPAIAGGYYFGVITEVQAGDSVIPPRRGWILVAGTMTTPACQNTSWFVLDLTDTVAVLQYATAVTAVANGRAVRIYGTGTCDGLYERVMAVSVQ